MDRRSRILELMGASNATPHGLETLLLCVHVHLSAPYKKTWFQRP